MDVSAEIKDFFLYCVRLGLWDDKLIPLSYPTAPRSINCEQLQDFAAQQGLSVIVVDGLEKLPLEQKPPKPVLLQWIGEVLQGY